MQILLLPSSMNLGGGDISDTEISQALSMVCEKEMNKDLLYIYILFYLVMYINLSPLPCVWWGLFAAGRKAYSITWALQYVNLFMINTGYIILAGSALKVTLL